MRALLVLAAALLFAAPAGASERRPTLSELESEVMCPTCKTSLEQSRAPVAERMRRFIEARIAAGDTKSEIKAKLVDQFGAGVLAAPPKRGFGLLAWLLPLVGIAAGAAVLGVLARRWARAREPAPVPAGAPELNGRPLLDPELERRVDEELARYDA